MRIYNTIQKVNGTLEEKVIFASTKNAYIKANPDIEVKMMDDITETILDDSSVAKINTALEAAGFTEVERTVVCGLVENYLAERVDERKLRGKKKADAEAADNAQDNADANSNTDTAEDASAAPAKARGRKKATESDTAAA